MNYLENYTLDALPKSDDLLWTVIRDPLRMAVDAFGEVDLYGSTHKHHKATYQHVDCAACPNCRYKSFLEGIIKHEKLGSQFFHAYPQTIKTLTELGPVDAALPLEDLEGGMRLLAARVGTRFAPQERATALSHSHANHSCWGSIDLATEPDLLRMACKLYSSDFTCFGFERPPGCAVTSAYRGRRARAAG